MALTKLTADVENIQALSDKPNEIEGLTADQLKKKFDDAVIDIKSYNNDTLTAELDTALALKSPLASPTFTGTVVLPSTTSIGDVSNTEIGYVKGVTSAIQTQLNDGWRLFPTTLAYASADSPTGVVTTGVDVSAIIQEGYRMKYDQSEALTAYFPMDVNSTSTVGSFTSTDTNMSYSAGKFGNCAVFNGSTSKVVITDTALMKPTGAFTIGLWVKTSSTGSNKVLFQSMAYSTNFYGIRIRIESTNFITAYTANGTGGLTTLTGTTNVCDNSWHYVVVTYNNNYLQIYIDGNLETYSYAFTPAYYATNYVRIGCENSAGSDVTFMNGSIDDMYLINGYALSEEEIRAKYKENTAQGTGNIVVTKTAFVSATPTTTALTLLHSKDSMLSNSAISNIYYSNVQNPLGFNNNPEKWNRFYLNTGDASTGVVASSATIVNWAGHNLSVPIGDWNISFMCYSASNTGSAGSVYQAVGLSTANNSFSDAMLKTGGLQISSAVTDIASMFTSEKDIYLNAKTTYYLNTNSNKNSTTMYCVGTARTTVIKARCLYL